MKFNQFFILGCENKEILNLAPDEKSKVKITSSFGIQKACKTLCTGEY